MKRRTQLSEDAADYIRELIISGRLRPGDPVRQDEIAQELEISATPVREGLLILRGEGLVTLRPRRGWFVAEITSQDILDLFRAQALLAGELVSRATVQMDPTLLKRLVDLQAKLGDAAAQDDYDRLEQLNHEFHRAINLAAASPKLAWVLFVASRCAPQRFYSTIPGWPQASVGDHEAILAAVEAGDPEAARQAMAQHIEHAGHLLADNFEAALAAAREGS